MPKIKTHKTTAKRFKITSTGRVMRTPIGKSHLRRRKSQRVKRQFARVVEVTNRRDVKRVKKLIPYPEK